MHSPIFKKVEFSDFFKGPLLEEFARSRAVSRELRLPFVPLPLVPRAWSTELLPFFFPSPPLGVVVPVGFVALPHPLDSFRGLLQLSVFV